MVKHKSLFHIGHQDSSTRFMEECYIESNNSHLVNYLKPLEQKVWLFDAHTHKSSLIASYKLKRQYLLLVF